MIGHAGNYIWFADNLQPKRCPNWCRVHTRSVMCSNHIGATIEKVLRNQGFFFFFNSENFTLICLFSQKYHKVILGLFEKLSIFLAFLLEKSFRKYSTLCDLSHIVGEICHAALYLFGL